MAKIMINSEDAPEILGVNRPQVGNYILFIKELNNGQFVTTYENDEGKITPTGLNAVIFNGEIFRPYLLAYRSIWGVSRENIEINNITTKTPQTTHDGTANLFVNGSKELHTNNIYKVGGLYAGQFTSKQNKPYTWELLGLDIENTAAYKIKGGKIEFLGKSAKLADLQSAFDALEKRENARLQMI